MKTAEEIKIACDAFNAIAEPLYFARHWSELDPAKRSSEKPTSASLDQMEAGVKAAKDSLVAQLLTAPKMVLAGKGLYKQFVGRKLGEVQFVGGWTLGGYKQERAIFTPARSAAIREHNKAVTAATNRWLEGEN